MEHPLKADVGCRNTLFNAVPQSVRDGSYALGATKSETIKRVVIPAALPGIVSAFMLAISRAVGETMIVLMVCSASVVSWNVFDSARSITTTIAAEMGEVVQGSDHYFALFSIGIVLFLMTFFINMTADLYLHRKRK